MSEPASQPSVRIGSAERDAALEALGAHLRADRLDPHEYGQRASQVATARYATDLTPLFDDLPGGVPAVIGGNPPAPVSMAKAASPQSFVPRLMAVVPLVSLVLFFVFGFATNGWAWSWLFFLLTPIAGAVLYGDSKALGQNRRRNRNANRTG
jgi:hypothetical protein